MKHCTWPSGVEERGQCQAAIDVGAHDDGRVSADHGSLDESGELVCIAPAFPGNVGVGRRQVWSDQPLDLRMKGTRFGSPISTNFDDRDGKPVFDEHIGLRYHMCVSPCRHTSSNQDVEASRFVIGHALSQWDLLEVSCPIEIELEEHGRIVPAVPTRDYFGSMLFAVKPRDMKTVSFCAGKPLPQQFGAENSPG